MIRIGMIANIVLFTGSAALVCGCHKAKGQSPAERRAYAQGMQRSTLQELYRREPQARREIENAIGYGVFSDIGTHLIITATGQGYGIVTDKRNGQQTYMRMASFGAGLGLGLQHFKAVFIFNDPVTLDEFVDKGWEFGAEADAAAKGRDRGGDVAAGGSLSRGMKIYRFTEKGVMLEVTLAGTKYWRDKELN